MKRKILILLAALSCTLGLSACTQKDRVSYNLSKEADNFNVVRQPRLQGAARVVHTWQRGNRAA